MDGAVVGYGVVGQDAGAIQGLYVSPDVKGRGVGRELLRTLEERARAYGLKSLRLTSSLNAVTFYERAGFRAVEELRETIGPRVVRASVRMFKELVS